MQFPYLKNNSENGKKLALKGTPTTSKKKRAITESYGMTIYEAVLRVVRYLEELLALVLSESIILNALI